MKANNLVREAYFKILPIQILSCVVNAVNSLVDSTMTSNILGTNAMAAVGFFTPVCNLIGSVFVICVGIQILCSKYLGSGDGKKTVSVFSTGIITVAVIGIVSSLVCFTFRVPLSFLLGAEGETAVMLQDYIAGYSLGMTAQMLSGTLMMFLPMNNDMKRSYFGIGVMIVSNIGLNILFITVFGMGLFGLGLATSLSFILSTLVLMTGFLKKHKVLRITLKEPYFLCLPSAVYLGLPSLMFTLGNTIKAYILNKTLMFAMGDAAVAAMAVQGTMCALLGSIPAGYANSFIVLGSMYYGEQDKKSMIVLMKDALVSGILISAAAALIVMAGSSPIASIFYRTADPAWAVTRRMLVLFPNFLVFNTIFNLLIKVTQCQKKMALVNFLSVFENVSIAIFTVVMTPSLGTDAAWLAFPAGEIFCLIIIAASVFIRSRGFTFRLEDWMKLDKDFGFNDDECLDLKIKSSEEVVSVSERVMSFCLDKNVDKKKAMYSGLCVEEMAGNIVEYGFKGRGNHSVDVRIVVIKDGMIIRIRDNTKEFDPTMRLEQYKGDKDVTKNIGIRIVAGLAEDMTYRSTAGVNNLLIKL